MRMLVGFIKVRMKMKFLFVCLKKLLILSDSQNRLCPFSCFLRLGLKYFLKMQKVNIKMVACDEFFSIFQKITFTFLYLIKRASLRKVRSQNFLKGGARRGNVIWAQDHRVKSSEYFCSFGLKTSNFRLNFMLSKFFYNLSTTIKYFSLHLMLQ